MSYGKVLTKLVFTCIIAINVDPHPSRKGKDVNAMTYANLVESVAQGAAEDDDQGVILPSIPKVLAELKAQGIKPGTSIDSEDLEAARSEVKNIFCEVVGLHPMFFESHKGSDGYFVHNPCGTRVLFATVYHSIHYKEFGPGVGGGEVHTESVPYCPTCQSEPDAYGEPILESMFG